MVISMEAFVYSAVTVSVIVISVLVAYFKYYAFTYWEKRGVPYSTPTFPAGNIGGCLVGIDNLGLKLEQLYNEFKAKGHKHSGIYFLDSPLYMPLDPEIVKHILIKDFQHFVDRGVYYNEEHDPLSAHLFAIEGLKWKNIRNKLSPTFTSGKMKMMFDIIRDCSNKLDVFCEEAIQEGKCLNIKDVLARYTTDIIGSCAFGLECNSLKDPKAEFRLMGKKIFDLTTWQAAKSFVGMGYPSIVKFLNLTVFDRTATQFFIRVFNETVKYRELNNIKRNDFLQLLIQMKNEDDINDETKMNGTKLSMLELAAQAFVFFIAGFETSSTTMTFCLYELSQHKDIQEKVREEILSVLKEHDGKMTYEGLMKMTYMDKVINETLRKYPPVTFLNRKCTSDSYKVPETNLTLKKGSNVIISVLGLQRDPEFYPDPLKFDPERFSEQNKANRHPCTFLPFGEGPRICIGLRFGIMQAKAGLTTLLRKYSLSLNPATGNQIEYYPKSIVLTSKRDILLDIKKL